MDSILSFMIDLVSQAGKEVFKLKNKTHLHVEKKLDRSLVSEADLLIEDYIISRINSHYPNDSILSEEKHPVYQTKSKSPVWILDPLDGTTNYVLGLPYWGILLTYLKDNLPIFTVNYFPALQEMYSACAGKGAFFNGNPIEKNKHQYYRNVSFFSCCSRTFKNFLVKIPYKVRIFGCAAYSMCCLVRDIAIISFEAQAKIWDIAGAKLILEESGCRMDVLYGQSPFPLIEGKEYNNQNYPIIAAQNEELLNNCKNLLIPI